MKWRCANDSATSRYCTGTPEWEVEPRTKIIAGGNGTEDYVGGKCKLSPETCGKCKTSQQMWDEAPGAIKAKVTQPSYIENIIPIEKTGNETTDKPKSKKARKLEAESAQRKMFDD